MTPSGLIPHPSPLTPLPLRGAARLAVVAIGCACLAGCHTPHRAPAADEPRWESVIWQGNAAQALAYDLRCDGELDWSADCAPPQMRTELADLKGDWPAVPAEVRETLREKASTITERWDGR